jgi:hypothetical protein
MLFPYIEQQNLYTQIYMNANYNVEISPKTIICPSDPTVTQNGQQASAFGFNGFFGQAICYAVNPLLFGTLDAGPNPSGYTGALLTAPTESGGSLSSYGTFVFYPQVPQYNIGNIPDGNSNTIAFSEISAVNPQAGALSFISGCTYGPQVDSDATIPSNSLPQFNVNMGANPPTNQTVQGWHTAILIVGLADGSVRNVSSGIGNASGNGSWQYALGPADGAVLGPDW